MERLHVHSCHAGWMVRAIGWLFKAGSLLPHALDVPWNGNTRQA